MLLTRAMIPPTVFVLTALAFAQDAMPEALRLRVDQGTVTKYGGKSDSATTYAFSFATGPGGARLPNDLRDQLKVTFERDFERLPIVGRSGNIISLWNSTETVLEAKEDGTRVVQVESYSQTSGLIGIGQTVDQKFTRTHVPDGGVSFGDLSIKVERNRSLNESQDLNDLIIKGTEQGARTNLILNAVILSGCYQAASGEVVPLKFDPKVFAPVDSSSANPEPLEPVRVGDLRLTRNPDGGAECRISLEPKRYGLKTGPVVIVTRWTLQFLPDGRLEHSEFISSTIINNPEVTDFEFDGKTYRVRYVRVFRSSGSSDRLD
jgi:hypothetical protein